MSFKKKFYKFTHWEFWPVYMFYLPNVYYALYYALIEKSLTFYTLANPGILNGGIGTESKFETQKLIPNSYVPKTVFHSRNSNHRNCTMTFARTTSNYWIIIYFIIHFSFTGFGTPFVAQFQIM